MSDPWKDLVDQIRDLTDAGYGDGTILDMLKDKVDLKEPHPGFAPCPVCHQYSHSLGEGVLTDAFNHFQSMFSHRGDGIPTQFTFDEKTRDAAQVLMALVPKPKPGPRYNQVCRYCRSEDVLCDAYAVWSVENQEWELHSVYDKGASCQAEGSEMCKGGDTRIDQIEIDEPPV